MEKYLVVATLTIAASLWLHKRTPSQYKHKRYPIIWESIELFSIIVFMTLLIIGTAIFYDWIL